MEADFLEKFKFIENLVRGGHAVTPKRLSKEIDISYQLSKQVIYEFFISRKSLENYIIIFQIELVDGNALKTMFVPSYSQLLDSIINNLEVLDFSVFAILKKEKGFDLKDLSVLYNENDVEVQFVNDGSAFSPMKITPSLDQENEIKPQPVKSVPKADTAPEVNSTQIKNGAGNSNATSQKAVPPKTNTQNNAKQNAKGGESQKKSQDKINFNASNKQKQETNNHIPMEVIEPIVQTHSINSKDKMVSSFENNFKIKDENIILEDPEEEQYYGGKIETKVQTNKEGVVTKRKASPEAETVEKKKKAVPTPVPEEISDSEGSSKVTQAERKKVKKTRKVLKTRYAQDSNGYLNSIDEYVDEEYWSDEVAKPIVKKQVQSTQQEKGGASTKGKKAGSGQGSLLSFFGKK